MAACLLLLVQCLSNTWTERSAECTSCCARTMGTSCRKCAGAGLAHDDSFMSAITGIQHSLVCVQYLLHFNASDESGNLDTVHQQISKAGAHVSSYIPDNTLLVVAQPEKLEALKRLAGVLLCLSYSPDLTCPWCITHNTVVVFNCRHCALSWYRGSMGG